MRLLSPEHTYRIIQINYHISNPCLGQIWRWLVWWQRDKQRWLMLMSPLYCTLASLSTAGNSDLEETVWLWNIFMPLWDSCCVRCVCMYFANATYSVSRHSHFKHSRPSNYILAWVKWRFPVKRGLKLLIVHKHVTSVIKRSSACPLVMFLLYHLWEGKVITFRPFECKRKLGWIYWYTHVDHWKSRKAMTSNSLKSFEVGAKFFCYICAGYKPCHPKEREGKFGGEKSKIFT